MGIFIVGCWGVVQLEDEVQGIDGVLEALKKIIITSLIVN